MWDYQLILFERSLQLTRWKVENLKSNKSSILESVTALTIMISSTPSFLNVANLLRLAILYLKTEASEPWKMINCKPKCRHYTYWRPVMRYQLVPMSKQILTESIYLHYLVTIWLKKAASDFQCDQTFSSCGHL